MRYAVDLRPPLQAPRRCDGLNSKCQSTPEIHPANRMVFQFCERVRLFRRSTRNQTKPSRDPGPISRPSWLPRESAAVSQDTPRVCPLKLLGHGLGPFEGSHLVGRHMVWLAIKRFANRSRESHLRRSSNRRSIWGARCSNFFIKANTPASKVFNSVSIHPCIRVRGP